MISKIHNPGSYHTAPLLFGAQAYAQDPGQLRQPRYSKAPGGWWRRGAATMLGGGFAGISDIRLVNTSQ